MSDTRQASPAAVPGEIPDSWARLDADRAVTKLYSLHYRSLVRLAAFLVGDISTAEELVQDSFVGVYTSWRRLRDCNHALFYLRRSVVNRSHSVLRHRAVVRKSEPKLASDAPAAEQEVIIRLDQNAVVSALRALPIRQREVLVLRYYAGLSQSQTASAMGISISGVKGHTARALSSLRAELCWMGE
jgi:RNA polymerase sigma-70 factor (sigma-E family)